MSVLVSVYLHALGKNRESTVLVQFHVLPLSVEVKVSVLLLRLVLILELLKVAVIVGIVEVPPTTTDATYFPDVVAPRSSTVGSVSLLSIQSATDSLRPAVRVTASATWERAVKSI